MEDGMEHGRCGIVIAAAALIALAALFAVPGDAADDSEADFTSSDGLFTCTVISSTDNTVEISAYDVSPSSLVIPSTVSDGTATYTVIKVADNGFANCTNFISVTIPDTVTTIGSRAFSGCIYLDAVIPSTVTSIGEGAFSGCASISVDSGNTGYVSDSGNTLLTDHDGTTLNSAANVSSAEIPSTVTSIGKDAFRYCYSLTSVEIPDSVTHIGDSAFLSCHSLESVAIPSSVTSIGYEAFYLCSGLTSVAVPSATMGGSVFDRCTSISTVYMDSDAYSADLFPDCATEPTRFNYTYTVTFDANGGNLSGDSTAAACYGSAFSFGQTAYRSGYDFAGWNTAADGSGTYVTDGAAWTYFSSADTSDVTLYAQWEVPGESDGDGVIIAVVAIIAAAAVILLAAAYNRSRKKQ